MSLLTRAGARRFWVLWICANFVCLSVFADSQSGLNQSLDDYYKALKAHPHASSEMKRTLQERYVKSAERKSVQAAKADTSHKFEAYLRAHDPRTSHGQDVGDSDLRDTFGGSQPMLQPRPHETVDGSGVPAEIDFPGTPKKSP